MSKIKLLIIAVVVLGMRFQTEAEHVYKVTLDPLGSIVYNWVPHYYSSSIQTEIHIPKLGSGWFAVGFSDHGATVPADYCVLWSDWKGGTHFQDTWAHKDGVLMVDKQQDCLKFKTVTRGNVTKFTYVRKYDTCDEHDYVIEDGTTHIVWVRGKGPLYRLSGLNISSSSDSDRGMNRVQLLKNTMVNTEAPVDAHPLELLTDKVQVPSNDTTYWCHVHKLPEKMKNKHHVVQFEAVIQKGNEGLVHHMEVFHCVAPVNQDMPVYKGNCFASDRPTVTQVCKRVLAAWAMGATPFVYPKEAGLPIGGPDFNPYVMLEVHYNNPEKKSDWVDSSGIRLYVTSKLRKADAGIIELGLEYTDKMAIPPGQEKFSLTGYCVTECTAVSLPPEGIFIFGSQLHTHLTGITVATRHIRNGRELAEVNRDNHYSTHFQEIRRLKRIVNVLPGDALLTTCDYSTIDRDNVTLGGFAISDEMCVNYVHYYPSTPLEVCKSAVSDQALATYFRFMNEWENQKTSPNLGVSDNYRAIRWTRMRVQVLHELYHEAPLSMQCNMSSGDRFPGYWENTPVTPVLMPLPPPMRECKDEININR